VANFCIMPEYVDKFKKALVDGKISPEKLANMSSKEREAFLKDYVGEGIASKVNAEFESKLLLKNQKQGMITWAKQVAGINKATRMDIIAKIERMDRVLQPEEGKQFMAALAERRLGVGVTEEQAKTILQMSKGVTEAKAKQNADGSWKTNADRLEYGRQAYDMTEFVNDLRTKAKSMKLSDITMQPTKFVGKVGTEIASNAKAINASMDNSAIFRQGWKVLWTDPGTWLKNAPETFRTLVREFGGKNVEREVTADIISRPTYDLMKKAKLYVGNLEEAFPTTLPEKIPLLGRTYKATESAYTTFVHKTRADVFDKYIEIAKKSGVDIADTKELEAIGKLVNSLTGRGNLGKLEPVGNVVNNVFFSPRFVKANIDTLIQPLTAGTSFARKKAAINLVKIISGTAGVLATANALNPGSVEWDPRSSDFGKIRIGSTRFDVTGGMASLATLAGRLAMNSTKSSTSGVVTQLGGTQPGAQSRFDVVVNFFSNKLSPAAGVLRDIAKGQDFNGNKITVGGEIYQLFTPMGVKNYNELAKDPNSANIWLSMIADGLGIATNTYQNKGSGGPSWQNTTSKELLDFKSKVGEDKFTEANKQFDTAYNTWLTGVRNNPEWDKKSSDDKLTLMQKEQAQLKKDIYKMYNFKYKAPKTPKTDTSLLKALNNVK